jgi:hypothetical protein
MIKTLLALALPLLAQSPDRAPWEIADSWSCTMDRIQICDGTGSCRSTGDPAFFLIDFASAKFWVRDIEKLYSRSAAAQPRDWRETIVTRSFNPYVHGIPEARFELDSGDFATIGSTPTKDGAYAAQLTRKHGTSQHLFHGTCSPDAKAP